MSSNSVGMMSWYAIRLPWFPRHTHGGQVNSRCSSSVYGRQHVSLSLSLVQAFGNACTVANNNSSRFGKFILVNFRENGAYHG